MPVDAAKFWTRKVRLVRLRINFGWLIDRLLPLGFAACLCFTVLVLAGRRAGWPERLIATCGVLAAMPVLAASFALSRHRFLSSAQARAQIDFALHLHNRLTAAAEGIGRWPDAAAWKPGAWMWNWPRLTMIPAACAALIGGAFLVSIPAARPPLPQPTAKPPALSKVEEWIEKLEKSSAVDSTSLEQVKEKAEQLGRESADEWYSHAGLEAADHLKNELASGIKSMQQNATKVESLLAASGDPALSEEQAGKLGKELEGALSALGGNVPALDKDLMGKLSKLDPSKLRDISPEQLKELKQRLDRAREAGGESMGENGESEGDSEEGEVESEHGGRGGLSRGPGAAKLTFDEHPANLSSSSTKGVENPDMSHAALGETIGVSAGQHDVDKGADHRAQTGGAAGEGAGPGTVWMQQNLTPREQRQIQQFFK